MPDYDFIYFLLLASILLTLCLVIGGAVHEWRRYRNFSREFSSFVGVVIAVGGAGLLFVGMTGLLFGDVNARLQFVGGSILLAFGMFVGRQGKPMQELDRELEVKTAAQMLKYAEQVKQS